MPGRSPGASARRRPPGGRAGVGPSWRSSSWSRRSRAARATWVGPAHGHGETARCCASSSSHDSHGGRGGSGPRARRVPIGEVHVVAPVPGSCSGTQPWSVLRLWWKRHSACRLSGCVCSVAGRSAENGTRWSMSHWKAGRLHPTKVHVRSRAATWRERSPRRVGREKPCDVGRDRPVPGQLARCVVKAEEGRRGDRHVQVRTLALVGRETSPEHGRHRAGLGIGCGGGHRRRVAGRIRVARVARRSRPHRLAWCA